MATKKEILAQQVAQAVGAGKTVALETVDFNDPNRPKTCLEVDFPILPVNQVAVIEGNAGKPIYQMSKWWARRRSSVFRSMLIAAATKAPEDKSHAAKLVWDNYYANHQKKGAFKHLRVADIFMGGGTTLVEGSRLGMQMIGNDLNPVAWFVVKQELANVDLEEVKRLLADIEAEVKPQIMPYYYCDGPEGEKGTWTHLPTQQVMPADFDPLTIPRDQRKDYRYEGPEIIYTFWAKHGPCQVTGCGHRTPIMSSPVMAVKTLSVKHWEHTCGQCGGEFHIEEDAARMAPDAPLYVAPTEHPFSVLDRRKGVICPHCGHAVAASIRARDGLVIEGERGQIKLGKGKNKKVELSLLVHPQWLAGSPGKPPPQPSPHPQAMGREYSSPQRGEVGRGELWYPKPVPEALLQAARSLRTNMTDAEQLLWHCLRGKQLDGFRFRKQHPLESFVLDFFCPSVRLAIELDGGQHNTDRGQAHDEERTRRLRAQGIRVLRFWNHEVFENLDGVLARIWEELHVGLGGSGEDPHPNPPPLGEGVHPSPCLGESDHASSAWGEGEHSLSGEGEKNHSFVSEEHKKHSSPQRGEVERGDDLPREYGGSAQDDAASTALWNQERASKIRLLEVRGALPEEVTCPETKITFAPENGTVPKPANFACAACGTVQPLVSAIEATGKTAPSSTYAIQGYAPMRDLAGRPYNGRFFAACDEAHTRRYDAAFAEWEKRKDADLKDYWPRSAIPFGHMTHQRQPLPRHGYLNWSDMFNPRQLLVHAQLLKAIVEVGNYDWTVREYVLGAYQQYLRNQCLFSFWNPQRDTPEPMFSNNNYHPKSTVVENCVFPALGRGNWASSSEGIVEGREWAIQPWEAVSVDTLKRKDAALASGISGKSEKVFPGDPVMAVPSPPPQPSPAGGGSFVSPAGGGSLGASPAREGSLGVSPAGGGGLRSSPQRGEVGRGETRPILTCGSSTDLAQLESGSLDLVITDPPFGGLLHYSELSDFFYVWLRLALKGKYPEYFSAEYTPKSLEAVANKAREPEDPDGFYQRLLTQCWREAYRLLKPGGILAFTFHHSEDEPWVAVLESLFDAGYYLEATYPIRSDETKGEGEFGSKTIEYDIIHVCRKRTEEPKPVSWGRMRREVMADVRQLQAMLENHAKEGLPAADIQVIRRGKALEYFSRHYGKVYVDEGRTLSVKEALVGINQLIDEDADKGKEPPPVNAEPMTRQFLRTFGTATEMKRDQLQKFLRGTITTPDEFVQRGWCSEVKKVFTRTHPLDFARDWSGKHKRKLTSDLDQALVLIGACVDGSGINAMDTLKNDNFKPHVALKPLLEWLAKNGPDQTTRNAASRAVSIFNSWKSSQGPKPRQISLFDDEAEYA